MRHHSLYMSNMASLCYFGLTLSTSLRASDTGSTYVSMTRNFQTPCRDSTMKHVSTSAEFNGHQSFLEKNASSTDKKRQHDREIYSLMSDEQKQERLRKNREYKKCRHTEAEQILPNKPHRPWKHNHPNITKQVL